MFYSLQLSINAEHVGLSPGGFYETLKYTKHLNQAF